MPAKKTTSASAPKLPAGILASDLKYPSYKSAAYKGDWSKIPYEDRQFDLWFTPGFGWCIPTLLISKTRRSDVQNRTYAVTVTGRKVVRIGRGPHVTATHTVYVTPKRHAALSQFLDIRRTGQAGAGEIRDRISSRRAQGQQMRAEGRSYWRWDV